MAFDLNKFQKYTWLAGAYAFYAVYATKNPADPFGQMWTDVQAWMTDPLGKIQTKINSVITIILAIIFAPIVSKVVGSKIPALKIAVSAFAYYIIGDQLASIVNQSTPGVFGATRGKSGSWGGERSAFHQNGSPAGVIKNIYGG